MLVRRDSWLLGGQLPLRFMLHYSLLPTLSLVLHPPAAVSPSPAPGTWRIQPTAGDCPSTLRSVIMARSLFGERGFQGRKVILRCLWVHPLHGTEGSRQGWLCWCILLVSPSIIPVPPSHPPQGETSRVLPLAAAEASWIWSFFCARGTSSWLDRGL